MNSVVRKVLVFVDNDDDEIKIFEKVCEKAKLPFEVKTFKSGQSFLDYIANAIKKQLVMPEHILIDINMPGQNGFETVEELKSMKEWKNDSRITFFTNSTWEKDKKVAQDMDAGFMTKPENINDYIIFLKSIA